MMYSKEGSLCVLPRVRYSFLEIKDRLPLFNDRAVYVVHTLVSQSYSGEASSALLYKLSLATHSSYKLSDSLCNKAFACEGRREKYNCCVSNTPCHMMPEALSSQYMSRAKAIAWEKLIQKMSKISIGRKDSGW